MIIFTDKTVFNVGAQALVNTVNTFGVMGAGIALEFALRYPEMLKDYEVKCENKQLKTGMVDYYRVNDSETIINFPTKQHYKYPSKLIWIEEGLKYFVDTYENEGIKSVAFPKLGCANGKLNWEDVRPLMEKYLSKVDADVYICEASKSVPEGKEKNMVDAYNEFVLGNSFVDIKLNEKQKNAIITNGPVKRFYEIREIEGIKGAPYKKIFNAFYEDNGQISFF